MRPPCGLSDRSERRRSHWGRARGLISPRIAGSALPAAVALGALMIARPASAYPTSIVLSPSGEALPFGSSSLTLFGAMGVAPPHISFGGTLGGITLGLLPSIDLLGTPAGAIAFAGGELGIDVGADSEGRSVVYFNAKIQALQETKYWPALSVGVFQLSPQNERDAALGYLVASKGFSVGDTYLGQLTFGLMRSFGDDKLVTPLCLTSVSRTCVFRGSTPFLDRNGALLAGYFSPWFGPFGFAVDYVGGTSDVSSANLALLLRVWHDSEGGIGLLGAGGFLGLDRRASPPGPGVADGVFLQLYVAINTAKLFGFSSLTDWGRKPGQVYDPRATRAGRDDSLGAKPAPPPPPPPKPVMREIVIEDDDTPLPEAPKPEEPVTEPPKPEPPKAEPPEKAPPKKGPLKKAPPKKGPALKTPPKKPGGASEAPKKEPPKPPPWKAPVKKPPLRGTPEKH